MFFNFVRAIKLRNENKIQPKVDGSTKGRWT